MHSESLDKIALALSKAQSVMSAAKFDMKNPHFKSSYASLTAVIDAIREPLAQNNLAYTQVIEGETLVTMLVHAESGQWIKSMFPLLVEKKTSQQFGSALTYAKRYSLSAIVGISADEDDDGNAASVKPQPVPATSPIRRPDIPTIDWDNQDHKQRVFNLLRSYGITIDQIRELAPRLKDMFAGAAFSDLEPKLKEMGLLK